MATFLVILITSLIISGSIAGLIVIMILILVKKLKKSQSTLSDSVIGPIYEEPDHRVNDEIMSISDNVAYSCDKLLREASNVRKILWQRLEHFSKNST